MGIANLATGGRVGYDGGGEVKDYMEIIDAVRKSRPELPEKKRNEYSRLFKNSKCRYGYFRST